MQETGINEYMPSNPRYQPKRLKRYLGYDWLYGYWAIIEISLLKSLAKLGIIPADKISLLTSQSEEVLSLIKTSECDIAERGDKSLGIAGTKHDVRAWISVARGKGLPTDLTRWIHWGFTSYDVISTATALMLKRSYVEVLRPQILRVMSAWADLAERYEGTLQIGRTHGQHAEPITAGFWIATCLARFIECYSELDRAASRLTGKISGPVGAYNAQSFFGLGNNLEKGTTNLEAMVLDDVGLAIPLASTQISFPERLIDFLYNCYKLSESIAQFADDCRHLMRTEVGEVAEGFEEGQDGSSAMPWKRNPMTFENLVGMAANIHREFIGSFSLFKSEHQRDLRGSSMLRQVPAVTVWACRRTLLKLKNT